MQQPARARSIDAARPTQHLPSTWISSNETHLLCAGADWEGCVGEGEDPSSRRERDDPTQAGSPAGRVCNALFSQGCSCPFILNDVRISCWVCLSRRFAERHRPPSERPQATIGTMSHGARTHVSQHSDGHGGRCGRIRHEFPPETIQDAFKGRIHARVIFTSMSRPAKLAMCLNFGLHASNKPSH